MGGGRGGGIVGGSVRRRRLRQVGIGLERPDGRGSGSQLWRCARHFGDAAVALEQKTLQVAILLLQPRDFVLELEILLVQLRTERLCFCACLLDLLLLGLQRLLFGLVSHRQPLRHASYDAMHDLREPMQHLGQLVAARNVG